MARLSSQTIAAVETALWDILGKSAGMSIGQMLGGTVDRIRLFGTGTTMFEMSADWHAHYFDAALAAGITAVKVRLGKDPEADTELVRVVRDRIGPGRPPHGRRLLGLFAGPGTRPGAADRAVRRGTSSREPSPQYMMEGMTRLAAGSPVRIAVGERVYSANQFAEIARRGAAHVFQPDVQICGGILECLDIAAIARVHDIEVVPHVGGPTAIGFAANLQWSAAAGVTLCSRSLPAVAQRDDRGAHIRDGSYRGRLRPRSSGPGLGIEVDESSFDRFPYVPGQTYAEIFPEHETGRA